MKIFYLLTVFSLIFFNSMDLRADGSPNVHALVIKGDYLFVLESSGLYILQKKGDGFSWVFEDRMAGFFAGADGNIWIFRQDTQVPLSFSCYIAYFDGNTWVKSLYPKIKERGSAGFFSMKKRSFLFAEDLDNEYLILYEYDGRGWKKITNFPKEYGAVCPAIYVRDEKIFLARRGNWNLYYTYNFLKNEWTKLASDEALWDELWATPDVFERDYTVTRKRDTIISPEGNVLVGINTYFPDPTELYRDKEGYAYVKIFAKSKENGYKDISDLWTDRSGEWKVIATGCPPMSQLVVANDSSLTVWGYNYSSYLAFLRDGQWIEVALLPPYSDSSGPDENDEGYDISLEQSGIPEDMLRGVINDPDGYVNVRSQPGAWAPVVAIILKDVPFFYKDIGNDKWSKVLLPSGTIGYVSSDRIKLFACGGTVEEFRFQTGDLLFQVGNSSDMNEAISGVTNGESHIHYTHAGIVSVENDTVFVIEATPPEVCKTPLDSFLQRAALIDGKPMVVVGRLKKEYRESIPNAITRAKKTLGKPYDYVYSPDDDAYYCSELITHSFLNRQNKPIFDLINMNFRDANGDLPTFWIAHFEKYDALIPENQPGSNPGDISKSEKIEIVFRYFQ